MSKASQENIGLFKHVQVDSDGVTVWVNTELGCIARFGRMGIDIHRVGKESKVESTECLFCTHGPVKKTDWHLFVAKMLELYRFKVPERYIPRRFRG
jgi:hypothetical protein